MAIERHTEVAETEAMIEWTQNIRAAGTGSSLGDPARGAMAPLVGTCGLNSLVWERGCRGEIGYDVARAGFGARR